MKMAADPGACPGCGLELAEIDAPTPMNVGASPACWALYGRLLVYQYSQPPSPRLHRLIVDAYAAQHPSAQEHRSFWSLGSHLVGLCLLLEHGASAHEANTLLEQMLERRRSFRWLEPPVPNGTITVSDVVRAAHADERALLVEQWAASVWDAWAPHHAAVRGWIDGSGRRSRGRERDRVARRARCSPDSP